MLNTTETHYFQVNSTIMTNTTQGSNETDVFSGITLQSVIYLCIGMVGVVENLLVTIIIGYSKSMMKKTTNLLIINQSIIDLCASLMIIATSMVRFDYMDLEGVWGDFYCKVWVTKSLMWAFFVASTYNLLILTVKKYMDIMHPLSKHMSKEQKWALVISIWLFGVFIQCVIVMPTTAIIEGTCMIFHVFVHQHLRKAVMILMVVIYLYFPISVMIFCHYKMYRMVIKRSLTFRTTHMTLTSENAREAKLARASRNIIKTLFIACMCFFLCWILNNVFCVLLSFGFISASFFTHPMYDISVCLAFCNCCTNPIIYTLQYQAFQTASRQMFCGKTKKELQQQELSSSESRPVNVSTLSPTWSTHNTSC